MTHSFNDHIHQWLIYAMTPFTNDSFIQCPYSFNDLHSPMTDKTNTPFTTDSFRQLPHSFNDSHSPMIHSFHDSHPTMTHSANDPIHQWPIQPMPQFTNDSFIQWSQSNKRFIYSMTPFKQKTHSFNDSHSTKKDLHTLQHLCRHVWGSGCCSFVVQSSVSFCSWY